MHPPRGEILQQQGKPMYCTLPPPSPMPRLLQDMGSRFFTAGDTYLLNRQN